MFQSDTRRSHNKTKVKMIVSGYIKLDDCFAVADRKKFGTETAVLKCPTRLDQPRFWASSRRSSVRSQSNRGLFDCDFGSISWSASPVSV